MPNEPKLRGAAGRLAFVIAALAGRSCRQLAAEFGFSEATAWRYQRRPWFKRLRTVVNDRATEEAREMLGSGTREAIRRLTRIVACDASDDLVAIRAARELLEAGGLVGPRAQIDVHGTARDPGEVVYATEVVEGVFRSQRIVEQRVHNGNGKTIEAQPESVEDAGPASGSNGGVARIPPPGDEEA